MTENVKALPEEVLDLMEACGCSCGGHCGAGAG